MCRRIARAILAAAAAGATVAAFGLTAAGSAGAATGPAPVVSSHHVAGTAGPAAGSPLVLVTRSFAGYHTAAGVAWRFRSVATTVSVAACKIAPNANPDGHVELFGGTNWTADVDVACNGGAPSVFYYDQKTATTHAQGAFRLAPRVGGLLRISISRNVAGHVDSFTVTNLRTRRSQTVRVITSARVVYQHAFVGSAIASNVAVLPLPPTAQLLWTFQATRVVTYGGTGGTLRGPWATVEEIDRTSGGVTVMYPGALSASGAAFSTFLNHA